MKTFLKGVLVGLTLGAVVALGLAATGFFPMLLFVPSVLLFVFSSAPLFSWAGAYAPYVVIGAGAVLAGMAVGAVAELVDRLGQGLWDLVSWLTTCCWKKEADQMPLRASNDNQINSSFARISPRLKSSDANSDKEYPNTTDDFSDKIMGNDDPLVLSIDEKEQSYRAFSV